jgi:hypothetical protein
MQSPDVEVATLKERMTNFDRNLQSLDRKVSEGFNKIDVALKEINEKIDQVYSDGGKRYVSLEIFNAFRADVESQLSKSWVSNTLSAILGAILTGLISTIYFLLTRR